VDENFIFRRRFLHYVTTKKIKIKIENIKWKKNYFKNVSWLQIISKEKTGTPIRPIKRNKKFLKDKLKKIE